MKNKVYYFTAKWCGPCKALKPFIEKTLIEGSTNVDIEVVDIDENTGKAKAFEVTSVPQTITIDAEDKVLQRNTHLSVKKLEKIFRNNGIYELNRWELYCQNVWNTHTHVVIEKNNEPIDAVEFPLLDSMFTTKALSLDTYDPIWEFSNRVSEGNFFVDDRGNSFYQGQKHYMYKIGNAFFFLRED